MNNGAWPAIIKDLMHEQRVSQRELTRLSGVYRTTLRRYLDHTAPFRLDHLAAVLHALGHYIAVMNPEGEAIGVSHRAATKVLPPRKRKPRIMKPHNPKAIASKPKLIKIRPANLYEKRAPRDDL